MGGVNNTDLRKRGFFAYVISTRGLTEGARAIRRADRSRASGPQSNSFCPPIQFWLPFASGGGASSNLIMAFASL